MGERTHVSAASIVREGVPASIADADLVARALDGDTWAEDAIYRRYARPLAAVATRLLGSRQDIEDLVHDTFVDAFGRLERLRDPSALRPWLMQIVVTKVRRTLRRRRVGRALGVLPAADDASLERIASRTINPELRAELAVIDGVLQRLPANDRIAWMLRYVEGHRLEDVARLCRCSLATAKRRIGAAKTAMARVIDVEEPRGGR